MYVYVLYHGKIIDVSHVANKEIRRVAHKTADINTCLGT